MRGALFAALLGTSALIAVSAAAQTSPPQPPADQPATQGQAPAAQPAAPVPAAAAAAPPAAQAASGPADLCKELLAYAEKKAAEPPKPAPGQAAAPAQAQAPAQPPAPPQAAPQPACRRRLAAAGLDRAASHGRAGDRNPRRRFTGPLDLDEYNRSAGSAADHPGGDGRGARSRLEPACLGLGLGRGRARRLPPAPRATPSSPGTRPCSRCGTPPAAAIGRPAATRPRSCAAPAPTCRHRSSRSRPMSPTPRSANNAGPP